MTKRIFIAATRQNDGKTTISLGIVSAFKRKIRKVGFIKPIGQRYLIEGGYKVDEDSVLIERVCNINCKLKDMSPIAIERGFTERYILKADRAALGRQIKQSFERVAKGKDMVVIEGTGHAGVGSVFDWSNAQVARFLNSKVLLVCDGGIGRPIDEIMLNKALFDSEDVELLGVIVNKVHPEKYKKINRMVRLGLARKGVRVFGVIPYTTMLSKPTLRHIVSEMGAEILSGGENLGNVINKVLVGAMEPHNALNYIDENCLLITPGDRDDMILTAMSSHLSCARDGVKIAGIILTGGLVPNKAVMKLIKGVDIPVLLLKDDTYKVASDIHDLIVKVQPQDKEKINTIGKLIEKYVDVEGILRKI